MLQFGKMLLIEIFHWAQSELKRIRVTDAQCSSHAGSYEQLMYGLVVQKLAHAGLWFMRYYVGTGHSYESEWWYDWIRSYLHETT